MLAFNELAGPESPRIHLSSAAPAAPSSCHSCHGPEGTRGGIKFPKLDLGQASRAGSLPLAKKMLWDLEFAAQVKPLGPTGTFCVSRGISGSLGALRAPDCADFSGKIDGISKWELPHKQGSGFGVTIRRKCPGTVLPAAPGALRDQHQTSVGTRGALIPEKMRLSLPNPVPGECRAAGACNSRLTHSQV